MLRDKPVVKVLLLTYQRAGSSYTGELLTSGEGALYVFEPLFAWRKILGVGVDPKLEENSAKVLGDLLDCQPEVINTWRRKGFYYFRKKPEGVIDFCRDAHLRLLKSIRARAHFVKPWITRRPDIKVVHLVRDPRGILNSVKKGGRLWSNNNRNVALQCANIENDLLLEDLGPSRYLRVRYEDLVEYPAEETRRIFTFMGVNMTSNVLTYLQKHSGLGEIPSMRQKYLNTYRDSQYRHDHWKSQMDNREVEYIEHVCGKVMQRLHYHPLRPT
ncbi:carbohydrate sulfotransferase 1-like [Homarus americanus]|nr:carbohydrate sulfotransferase 1-like [Homarus americanus]